MSEWKQVISMAAKSVRSAADAYRAAPDVDKALLHLEECHKEWAAANESQERAKQALGLAEQLVILSRGDSAVKEGRDKAQWLLSHAIADRVCSAHSAHRLAELRNGSMRQPLLAFQRIAVELENMMLGIDSRELEPCIQRIRNDLAIATKAGMTLPAIVAAQGHLDQAGNRVLLAGRELKHWRAAMDCAEKLAEHGMDEYLAAAASVATKLALANKEKDDADKAFVQKKHALDVASRPVKYLIAIAPTHMTEMEDALRRLHAEQRSMDA